MKNVHGYSVSLLKWIKKKIKAVKKGGGGEMGHLAPPLNLYKKLKLIDGLND